MTVQEIVSEFNAIPLVGGTVICSSSGNIIFHQFNADARDESKGKLSQAIVDLFHNLDASGEDFVEVSYPGTRNSWAALRSKGLIMVVLLYSDADLYMIKLQMGLSVSKLVQEKEIKKAFEKENVAVVATAKEVKVLDLIQFHEHLKRERISRGIIISERPYNERVNEELMKAGERISIIVSDNVKQERKSQIKKLESDGYSVKQKTIVTDRGM